MSRFKKYRLIQKGSLFFLENQKTGAVAGDGFNNKTELINLTINMSGKQINYEHFIELVLEITKLPIPNSDPEKVAKFIPQELSIEEEILFRLETEITVLDFVLKKLVGESEDTTETSHEAYPATPDESNNFQKIGVWVSECGTYGSVTIGQNDYEVNSKELGIQTCIFLLSLKKISQPQFDWLVEIITNLPKLPYKVTNDQYFIPVMQSQNPYSS